jgi:hypothetical protein
MTIDTGGGPAFPLVANNWHRAGMTLRDYFAAKAMQATVQAWITNHDYPSTDFEVAINAYKVADAMLKARSES